MRQWFDVLKLMHECARHLNRETRPKLAAFYRQKHTQVLTTEAQRSHFRSCFLSRDQTAASVKDCSLKNRTERRNWDRALQWDFTCAARLGQADFSRCVR